MDFTIQSRIWADSSLSTSEKMVLLALDNLGDKDGFSWWGYDKLGEMTGISAGSKYLTKIINKLESSGYILIWRQHGRKGGRGYTHIYWPIIGRTDEEILEIVMRRFIATEDEARAIINRSGPIYDDLIKRNRVSGKTLEDSRQIKKGVIFTPITNEGGTGYTQNPEMGVPETPNDEDDGKKGVLETPRSKEESNPIESIPNIESKRAAKSNRPHPIPAYQIFYEETGKFCLNKAQIKAIEETVGTDPPALEKWRDSVRAWNLEGNKPNNAGGMLDWYRTGKRSNYEPRNGVKQNGQHKSTKQPTEKPDLTNPDTWAAQLEAASGKRTS